MCGRYTLTRQEKLIAELEASLDPAAAASEWWKPRYNVAPTQPAPVVIRDASGPEANADADADAATSGRRRIELMRWGLVPFWAGRAGAKPPLMINARRESISAKIGAKAVFRDALARRRCLVPADGFYEWVRAGKLPQPVWFRPEHGPSLIAFAGLWAVARTDAGELRSFTIITAPADPLVAPVHDRMPVVLPRDRWDAWLDDALEPDAARELLAAPAALDSWVAQPVSTHVNKAANDDPTCIEPLRTLL